MNQDVVGKKKCIGARYLLIIMHNRPRIWSNN